MKTRFLIVCLFAWQSIGVAQPALDATVMGQQGAQLGREWNELRAANLETESTDPHTAIERYQTFFETRAFKDAPVSIGLSSVIAQLYAQNLNERDEAIEIYQIALQSYGAQPGAERLSRELDALKREAETKTTATKVNRAEASVTGILARASLEQTLRRATLKAPGFVDDAVADEAWRTSGLVAADLPPMILKRMANGASLGAANLAQERALTDSLAGLLVRHGERLWNPANGQKPKLHRLVRMAIADYYASQKNERAVELYEALLLEVKSRPKASQTVDELWHLADYYASLGEKEKQAETYLRADDYSTMPFFVRNSSLIAAHIYDRLGEKDKADAAGEKAEIAGED